MVLPVNAVQLDAARDLIQGGQGVETAVDKMTLTLTVDVSDQLKALLLNPEDIKVAADDWVQSQVHIAEANGQWSDHDMEDAFKAGSTWQQGQQIRGMK